MDYLGSKRLNINDHSREVAGMTYVYPVVSRRAGGVSIGINLNPNNACNWRCLYCQVPELKRGTAPKIDLAQLEAELRAFLHEIVHGDFMQAKVEPEARRVNDIALSGNGEPTSAREFDQVIQLIGSIKQDYEQDCKQDSDQATGLKLVLITNGSLIDRRSVQSGLQRMATLNGEVWFKLDRATREGRELVNGTTMSLKRMRENLRLAASLCATWVQTCVFQLDGLPPSPKESEAYLALLRDLLEEGVPLQGVLLYGLARASMQPEAVRLSRVSREWMDAFGSQIQNLGLKVKPNP